jgi:hypothetical protein
MHSRHRATTVYTYVAQQTAVNQLLRLPTMVPFPKQNLEYTKRLATRMCAVKHSCTLAFAPRKGTPQAVRNGWPQNLVFRFSKQPHQDLNRPQAAAARHGHQELAVTPSFPIRLAKLEASAAVALTPSSDLGKFRAMKAILLALCSLRWSFANLRRALQPTPFYSRPRSRNVHG